MSVDVTPRGDRIEHTGGDLCICGPRTEAVRSDNGSIGWVVIHHSLDGREQRE